MPLSYEALMTAFAEILPPVFAQNDLSEYLTEGQLRQFAMLGAELIITNEKMNLTAITDPKEIASKHFADSLLVLKAPGIFHFLPTGAKVLDVGCGGGFPCLPLAIARPDLQITALDSTAKKLEYVSETAQKLGLKQLKITCGRAEELAQTPLRESFDAVCARAVARLPILAELCLPFVRIGGYFIPMKGAQGQEELREAAHAISALGGKIEESLSISLQSEEIPQEREIFFLRKATKTPPLYPRLFTKIKKNPL